MTFCCLTAIDMSQTIEFFWDAVSPYTYLAATQIDRIATETGATVRWRPFFLAGVMEATGNRPPLTVKAKGDYMWNDLKAWAQHYNVPVTMPEQFPVNSVYAMRAAIAAEQMGKGQEFGLALISAYWADGKDLGDQATLVLAAEKVGLDAAEIATAMQTQAVKDTLRANSEEAVARGAFGAPTMFVGSTMFWGNDRLDLLQSFLTGDR